MLADSWLGQHFNDSELFVSQVACFNPEANSWSLVAPLPAGHGEPGIAVLDSRIYVLGGRSHDKGNRMKYVHVYNPDTDEWESQVEFKDRVSGVAACVVLMPPTAVAQAKNWEQCSKALRGEMDYWGESSED